MITLSAPASREEEVKKSRFIAHAARADTVEAATAFIESVSAPDATHNCWAYRIGSEYRFHDDGEPGGTAGKPIFAAIESQGLDHTVVAVIRYFGGVKLGAGGLARAYGGCAANCLREAPTEEIRPSTQLSLSIDFDSLGAVHGLIERFSAVKLDEVYGPQGVKLDIELPADALEAFSSALRDQTRGQGELSELTQVTSTI